MVKKSENLEKSRKITFFSKNLKILKIFFFAEKNAILLVLSNEEISLRPELSSPACFRIQGAGGTMSVTNKGRSEDKRKSTCVILDYLFSKGPICTQNSEDICFVLSLIHVHGQVWKYKFCPFSICFAKPQNNAMLVNKSG